MTFSIIFVLFGTIATIVACKTINGNFELKHDALARKEKNLVEAQKELQARRKELSRRLDNLKTLLKAGIKTEAAAKTTDEKPSDLKSWLVQSGVLTEVQFLSAEIYAAEKNLNVIAALLTLNMISIEKYEEAKKMKLL
ncbi:hypothetical protein [Maridesulfovibrio salexigens]|uniref:Uncharacterized protein n=1 Tax=Maridesulfovibrio salexigens (strain ATCC 14822 / DSM 2638 / NCIMB 8403 / VKM B-1763) TaxID=526222 RepID=C6BRS3_MARSD|nr:hypothetical protein [Maridesulfovibrio salexigens]ACS79513.1 hypothetical protein Desal_1451 [Maridesulfovibrio salexigens DSM 2638]